MENAIKVEIILFFNAFVLGVILIAAYDFFRIFRRIVKHTKTFEAIEDTIYWIIAGFVVFIMLYHNNNGIIRWFAIAGVTAGMLLYNFSVSKFVVKYVSLAVNKIILIISKILKTLFKPIIIVINYFYRYLKKSIKVLIKLCKSTKIKRKVDKNILGVKYNEKSKKEKGQKAKKHK